MTGELGRWRCAAAEPQAAPERWQALDDEGSQHVRVTARIHFDDHVSNWSVVCRI